MIRAAVILFAVAVPAAALAQDGGGARKWAEEPLSRAQVAQMIEDRGYFELSGLERQADGRWRCTALVAPGKRVAILVGSDGSISQSALPPRSATSQ